jgi:hypothetical protein
LQSNRIGAATQKKKKRAVTPPSTSSGYPSSEQVTQANFAQNRSQLVNGNGKMTEQEDKRIEAEKQARKIE